MIKWQQVDTVLLDMDGTLLDLSFDNFFWQDLLPRRYAEQRQLPLAEASALLEARAHRLRGKLEWYCLDHWSEALQMDIRALKLEVQSQIRYRPGTLEFLQWLQGAGKRRVLVTNAHPHSLQIKTESSGLHQHLDRLISSHEFQLAKENQGFWSRFQAREQVALERCLFIDDNPDVLACAQREGMGQVLQVLLPDTQREPLPRVSHWPGIMHFSELMQP